MLKFFGDGGAFDINRGSTSAYYIDGRTLILIDVGNGTFEKVYNMHLLDKVDKVEIFITHLHGDHVGSLASLCDYLKLYNILIRKIDFKIFYPNTENLKTLLKLMLIDIADKIVFEPNESKYVLEYMLQPHYENAYGYIFSMGGGITIHYSGDTTHINEHALELLKSGKIDYFYHEATNAKGLQHTNIEELDFKIPKNLRQKVYLMHLNDETAKLTTELGFNLVDIAF